MVREGRYGLEHPNAEAVGFAQQLWYLFGDEPQCREDIAKLYPRVIELLDATESHTGHASSLQGAEFNWGRVEFVIESHPKAAKLLEQLSLLPDLTASWGLRCGWAPHCLLHTLSRAHCEKFWTHEGLVRISPDWTDTNPITWPLFITGLQNPNSGGYVGDLVITDDGQATLIRADDGPAMSLFNLGPEELVIPKGTSLETKERLDREWAEEYNAIRKKFQGWGMIDPKGWRKLDEAIYWLFLRLKTGFGWTRLTRLINELEAAKRVASVEPRQWNNVSKRVRELQRILLIEDRPEAQMHTAKFKESPLWNKEI